MDESILDFVKDDIGISPEDDSFDKTIIADINGELMYSSVQRGIGKPITIQDESTSWGEFINDTRLIGAKKYIADRVHLVFDPPTNPTVLQALQENIARAEFDLMMIANTISKEGGGADV